MKRSLILFALLLCAGTANAQSIQSKACDRQEFVTPITRGGGYVKPCTFNKPVTAHALIVAPGVGTCVSGNCNPVTDSQGNVWQIAITCPYYGGVGLWYALDAKPGPTTVNFGTNAVWQAFIGEYPPSSGLDAATCNTYAGQNLDIAPGGSNDESWTWLETSQSGDLIIAWEESGVDLNSLYSPTPGFGFTLRGVQYGDFMFEDIWASGPGYYFPNMKWENAAAHWVMGAAAFKMQ
jgi:hypothetical protein